MQLASGQAARLAEMLNASVWTKNHLNSNLRFILTFLSLLGQLGAPKTAEELLVSLVF